MSVAGGKSRCDGSQVAGDKCSTCIDANLECTYLEAATKRVPARTSELHRVLEARLERSEALVRHLRTELATAHFNSTTSRPSPCGTGVSTSDGVALSPHDGDSQPNGTSDGVWDGEEAAKDGRAASLVVMRAALRSLTVPPPAPRAEDLAHMEIARQFNKLKIEGEYSKRHFLGQSSGAQMVKVAINLRADVKRGEQLRSDSETRESPSPVEALDPPVSGTVGANGFGYGYESQSNDSPIGMAMVPRKRKQVGGDAAVASGPYRESLVEPSEASASEDEDEAGHVDHGPDADPSLWTSRRLQYWTFKPWENRSPRTRTYVFPPPDLAAHLIGLYFTHMNSYIPLLHRPTFERAVQDNLQYRDEGFAATLLLVCAVASRWSDDPRVLRAAMTEGGTRAPNSLSGTPLSCGWEWFDQVPLVGDNLYKQTTLYIYKDTALRYSSWKDRRPQRPVGRLSVLVFDVGAHRRNSRIEKHTVESELWKRAFWVLVYMDRTSSAAMGRACAIQYDDFDLDLPIECDDEYWEHPTYSFEQPAGIPSRIAFFNALLRLNNIMAFCLKILYPLSKIRMLFRMDDQWEENVVAELDSALNKWRDEVPEHLRWEPNRADTVFFDQSVALHCAFCNVQILVHRPFIPTMRKSAPTALPSLAICTNAARACANMVDVQRRRKGKVPVFFQLSAVFTSAIMLLLNVWSGKRTGLVPDPSREIANVHKCMAVVRLCETRWQSAGLLWDILYELASVGQLPLPDPTTPVINQNDAGLPTIPPLPSRHLRPVAPMPHSRSARVASGGRHPHYTFDQPGGEAQQPQFSNSAAVQPAALSIPQTAASFAGGVGGGFPLGNLPAGSLEPSAFAPQPAGPWLDQEPASSSYNIPPDPSQASRELGDMMSFIDSDTMAMWTTAPMGLETSPIPYGGLQSKATDLRPLDETYHIFGVFCSPIKKTAQSRDVVQLLVHGFSYTSEYWSPAANEFRNQSYTAYACDRGLSTFAIDVVGAGQSTRPDNASDVQFATNSAVVSQLARNLKNASILPGVEPFKQVIGVGHSAGSVALIHGAVLTEGGHCMNLDFTAEEKYPGCKDGFIFPLPADAPEGTQKILCRCIDECNGGAQVSSSTYYRHKRQEKQHGPTRRAVPRVISTAPVPSSSKESRPRSDSGEGYPEAEFQSLGMDIDTDKPQESPMGNMDTIHSAVPRPVVPALDKSPNIDSTLDIEQLDRLSDLASDDEDLDYTAQPAVVVDIPESEEQTPAPAPAPTPPVRVAPPQPPVAHPTPATVDSSTRSNGPKFNAPPPWRSIPIDNVKIEKLRISLRFIEALESACRANSQLSPEDNDRLWNPPREPLGLDPAYRHALQIFMGADSPITEETFNTIRAANMARFGDGEEFPSFYQTKSKLAALTGITCIETDMCPQSCIAYTGPFAELDKCPYPDCNEPRYDQAKLAHGVREARAKFWTIPVGPFLQCLWRNPETAKEMKFRRETDEKIRSGATRNAKKWDDITAGTDYEQLVKDGTIRPTDMVLLFSIDGAQLYAHKESDCWIYIWIILDLRPGLRYKKKFVIPGGFIPGPKPPKNVDSFTFVGFHHLAVIQREGLPIWDASTGEDFLSYLYFILSTADAPGQQHMNGSNGHTSRVACRSFCGMVGRHRYGAPHYYPCALKPLNPEYPDEPEDIDLQSLRSSPSVPESVSAYNDGIASLLQSKSQNDYIARQTQCGFGKPSILSGIPRCLSPPGTFPGDLMHYILNIGDLFSQFWTGKLQANHPDTVKEWPWAVLVGEVWRKHGAAVAACHHFLPNSFDRVPRNPAEKINSGYKAKEWQHWIFGFGPALLYGLLPDEHWKHLCKLIHVIRLLHQYSIDQTPLLTAYTYVLQTAYEFETLYYQRKVERLHFVRHSIHNPIHFVQQVPRIGPPILYAQWTMERTIGNLGQEIQQPRQMFANLSQRGVYRAQINGLKAMDPTFDRSAKGDPAGAIDIGDGYQLRPKIDKTARPILPSEELVALGTYLSKVWGRPAGNYNNSIKRCARLALPNEQTARSVWCESEDNRVTRMVAFKSDLPEGIEIGEVQYYFRYNVEPNIPHTLAMVSVFGVPDRELLKESSNALWVARLGLSGMRVIPAKSIKAVVSMIPFPKDRGVSREIEEKLNGYHFMYEYMSIGILNR
ncbi:hypothetical protein FB45DRAFT_1034612 [Roridomyces roridus]|uniref:Xylanolytic transcriptional activator regulatory domain-containing protein n=1 Tax=Roridomyces roridus TaxID=1738132 RepID=A0AAD7FFQ8_9AGAR|nr:hypothetical protein FB45DRAFT_1034612 [Roridomyces roridus]